MLLGRFFVICVFSAVLLICLPETDASEASSRRQVGIPTRVVSLLQQNEVQRRGGDPKDVNKKKGGKETTKKRRRNSNKKGGRKGNTHKSRRQRRRTKKRKGKGQEACQGPFVQLDIESKRPYAPTKEIYEEKGELLYTDLAEDYKTYHHIVPKSKVVEMLNHIFCLDGRLSEKLLIDAAVQAPNYNWEKQEVKEIFPWIVLGRLGDLDTTSDAPMEDNLSNRQRTVLQTALQWPPGDGIFGPAPGSRSDDPGNEFEEKLCYATGCRHCMELEKAWKAITDWDSAGTHKDQEEVAQRFVSAWTDVIQGTHLPKKLRAAGVPPSPSLAVWEEDPHDSSKMRVSPEWYQSQKEHCRRILNGLEKEKAD